MKVEDIKKVGVVGAGLMGHGIAINSALWGYPTTIHDISDELLQKAMKNVKFSLDIFVGEGLIDRKRADETIKRITPTTDLAKLAQNSDFITEVIVEKSEAKYELFNKLDILCPPHTIIASNTSSLVLSDFGRGVKRQDKIVITHYFSPPHFVPGVEVAKGPHASDETFNITYDLMKKWKKVPIRILKEKPGYLINRIQMAIWKEAYTLWAEGVATPEEIDLGVRTTCGFRMPHEGPMKRHDMGGSWRWPKEVRERMAEHQFDNISEPTPEQAKKIAQHAIDGKTWLIAPDKFDEAFDIAYREYARRLKDLYWGKAD